MLLITRRLNTARVIMTRDLRRTILVVVDGDRNNSMNNNRDNNENINSSYNAYIEKC